MSDSRAASPIIDGSSNDFEEVLNMVKQKGYDFEKLCYGKGKQDDITVVSAWI
jgi:lipocalin